MSINKILANTPSLNKRIDYLDAVRAFALLLGIVFHASLSFTPIFIGWAVMDISTSTVVSIFILVSHSFRMELFFLIAGFFSHMTLQRKGLASFTKSRLIRIAIPFVLGWMVLRPLIVSAWVMGGESLRGDVNILNGLKAGFQSVWQSPHELFTGTHLWFLYYLLVITGIVLAFRALFALSEELNSTLIKHSDHLLARLVNSRFLWIILSMLTGICIWFMNDLGMDTPDKSLFPHWPVFIVYGGFFTFGWLLYRQQFLLEQFTHITKTRVTLCLISIATTVILTDYQFDEGHPNRTIMRALFSFSYAMTMWLLVALCIGVFKRFLNQPNKIVRYIADASYWLYLIHLPIVLWLQIAVAELPFHWSLKLTIISLLTIGVSLILYDLFVRSSFIGKILNGQRKQRVLL